MVEEEGWRTWAAAGYLFSDMDLFQVVPVLAQIFMIEDVATCIHDKATVSENKEHKLAN